MVSILMKASGHNVKYAILSMIGDNGSTFKPKRKGVREYEFKGTEMDKRAG